MKKIANYLSLISEVKMKQLMFEDNTNRITLYNDIDPQILEDASQAASRIESLTSDLALFDCVTDSLSELKDTCCTKRIHPSILHHKIEQRTRSFLSEFRSFINHWETKSKHQGEEYFSLFREATHHAYDSYEEYGFIYNLRNYAFHIGNVVSRIHGSIELDYIQPLANKPHLLQTFNKWKAPEKTFIQKQDDFFNLLPIFEKGIHALGTIRDTMMNAQITPQTICDCEKLMSLYEILKNLNSSSGSWDIVEFFDQNQHPIQREKLTNFSSVNITRYYANWDLYPILKAKSKQILIRNTKK